MDVNSELYLKIEEGLIDFQRWYGERYGAQAMYWWVKNHALWSEIQLGGVDAANAWWAEVQASELWPTNPGQTKRLETWYSELVGLI